MREIRPSGSEGGVAANRHPYPYFRLCLRHEGAGTAHTKASVFTEIMAEQVAAGRITTGKRLEPVLNISLFTAAAGPPCDACHQRDGNHPDQHH
jgi:hypothetical protein